MEWNKKDLFHEDADYQRFMALLAEYKKTYLEAIYHYCLMTNHVHVLLKAGRLQYLSKFSHYVQRRYAYYYCGRYEWTGSVFQRGFRSFAIEKDEHLLESARYIERNPLKAGLARTPERYNYSSCRFYAFGRENDLITPSPVFIGLDSDPVRRRELYIDYVKQIRLHEELGVRE